MNKNLVFIVLGILLIGLMGCEIKTPEIRGVVLDAETKQPVEGAWVSATIGIKTKTVAGDVGKIISLDTPHTRTGRDGRFVISRKELKKPTFPVSFGIHVDDVIIVASTVNDRESSIRLEGERLKKILEENAVDLTIYSRSVERTEEEYFSHLQSLYTYCLTGRFGFEIPPVESGCDEWELDYAITKHRRYLERYKKYADEGKAKGYFASLEQLSYLYEKKGDYVKAIETLKQSIALMERRGLLKFKDWQRDKAGIERRINELRQKLQEQK